jgi:hypothetical protein
MSDPVATAGPPEEPPPRKRVLTPRRVAAVGALAFLAFRLRRHLRVARDVFRHRRRLKLALTVFVFLRQLRRSRGHG